MTGLLSTIAIGSMKAIGPIFFVSTSRNLLNLGVDIMRRERLYDVSFKIYPESVTGAVTATTEREALRKAAQRWPLATAIKASPAKIQTL